MFNVNYKGTRRRSGIFIVNFEHSKTCSSVSIDNFDQVNADWKTIQEWIK